MPSYLEQERAIKSQKILKAFGAIDRADFVPRDLREAAYVDEALPIGQGQTISQPYTVAFMLELLDPGPGEKIMDIGAGSGWQTALLAYIVSEKGKVFALELMPELCEFGRTNVSKYNFIEKGIVEWFCRDASPGLPEKAPFDKIIAAANIGDFKIFEVWGSQLKIGGRIVAPVGNSLWLWIKQKDGDFRKKEFPGFVFVPFVNKHGN